MPTTTPDGLWSPEGSTSFNLGTILSTMQSSVQAALTKRGNVLKGPQSARLNYTSSAVEGEVWQQTDGSKQMFQFINGNWVEHSRVNLNVRFNAVGSAPSTINLGPQPPNNANLEIRSGYVIANVSALGSNGYFPQQNYSPLFPTACIGLSVLPIHVSGVTYSPIAVDQVSRAGHRAIAMGHNSGQYGYSYIALGY